MNRNSCVSASSFRGSFAATFSPSIAKISFAKFRNTLASPILNFRASTIGLRSNKIITTVCSGYPLRCSHLGGTSMFQNSTILETSLCGDNKPRFFDLNCSFEEVCAAITTSPHDRSEEHTSELQSLMRISYAVFCFKKKPSPTRSKRTYTLFPYTTLFRSILNFRASTIGLRSNKIITTVCSGYPLRCSHLGGTSMFQNSTILETSLCGDNKPRFFDLNCSFEEVCAAITTSPHDTLLRKIKSPEAKCPRSFNRSKSKQN